AEGTALSLFDLAEIMLHKGQLDSARALCTRCRDIARKGGYVLIQKNAMKMLAELSALKGDYAQAYDRYREFVTLKDSLLNEKNSRTIAELVERYDSEKKKAMISLLQKDAEVKQLELSRSNDALRLRTLEALQER